MLSASIAPTPSTGSRQALAKNARMGTRHARFVAEDFSLNRLFGSSRPHGA
jgi:hypothetical protein